jgi:hypothetical protein
VGAGIAVLRPDQSRIWGWDGQQPLLRGFSTGGVPSPVLPPQQETTVYFTVGTTSGDWTNMDVAKLTRQVHASMQGTDGQFHDSANDRVTRARFNFAFVLGSGW